MREKKLQVIKEELHFKPNQVQVIKASAELRDESIAEYLHHVIINMSV